MDSRNTDALDIARGDVGLSRYLHRAFTQIRNSEYADARTRAALDEVLSGQASLREFGQSEEFARLAERAPVAPDPIADMPQERRDQLAAAAQTMLDQLAAQQVDSQPVREPVRRADDDDEYFESRRRSGWLE